MPPAVDLVVVFRASSKNTLSKQQVLDDARRAEQQYSRLLDVLHAGGLQAVGRRGEHQGQLLVLLSCTAPQLARLVRRERHSDFLHGLPSAALDPGADPDPNPAELTPAERLRLVHEYLTSPPADGGLGVAPSAHGAPDAWDRVESVMALHDPDFNDAWIRALTRHAVGPDRLDAIRNQFGDAVAFYFAFLVSYTRALALAALAALATYLLGHPYSATYSSALLLWAVAFVETWRVRERVLATRWRTRGAFRVERRTLAAGAAIPWWTRELRILASVPVVLLFAGALAALLTAIFVLEAFVAALYTGPGHPYVSLVPTLLFVALVPRFLALYHARARALTDWERHAHASTRAASLTLKTFALSAVVAYLGLALSAFVYVPFGAPLMDAVQRRVLAAATTTTISTSSADSSMDTDAARLAPPSEKPPAPLFDPRPAAGRAKLNAARLQNQMFAYTVTNQALNAFTELGLPFLTRFVSRARSRRSLGGAAGGTPAKKKRVGFEDAAGAAAAGRRAKAERAFLERVRREVALPEYGLFEDYGEMVTQFGYVALWSTIWPLAPVTAYLNNTLELRADAFKIVTHHRRPLPARVDTIGPWLACLSFLTWLAALTNAALVYLFRPAALSSASSASSTPAFATALAHDGVGASFPDLNSGAGASVPVPVPTDGARAVFAKALLVALAASHAHLALRAAVRHVVERAVWKGSAEEARAAREAKARYLRSVEGAAEGATQVQGEQGEQEEDGDGAFWTYDEGLEEIRRGLKEA